MLCSCLSRNFTELHYFETEAINENLVCEGDTATLSCPGQEVIQVVDVLYGRNNKETCADNGNTEVKENQIRTRLIRLIPTRLIRSST